MEVLDRIMKDEKGRIAFHYVLIDFLCEVCGGELSPSSDAMDARWVKREELQNFDLPDITLRVIEKAWKLNCLRENASEDHHDDKK